LLYEAACAAHPELKVSLAHFTAGWAKRASPDGRFAGDVLLAVGIEYRETAALQWLQRQVHRAAQNLERQVPRQLLADVESAVLELVAVGTETRAPRITEYAARGPLVGWLQIIVTRMAQERATAPATRVGDTELESALLTELTHSGAGPELEVLHAKFQGALGRALRVAANQLSEKDRTLLRLHYVDGVGLHELSRAYQVHRATISRWLLAARDAYLGAMRDELSSTTGVARPEVDSLVRALQSRVEVSLRQLFGSG
jgi:RNA polymerase sigma-70 factor (ECF subfamily)